MLDVIDEAKQAYKNIYGSNAFLTFEFDPKKPIITGGDFDGDTIRGRNNIERSPHLNSYTTLTWALKDSRVLNSKYDAVIGGYRNTFKKLAEDVVSTDNALLCIKLCLLRSLVDMIRTDLKTEDVLHKQYIYTHIPFVKITGGDGKYLQINTSEVEDYSLDMVSSWCYESVKKDKIWPTFEIPYFGFGGDYV